MSWHSSDQARPLRSLRMRGRVRGERWAFPYL